MTVKQSKKPKKQVHPNPSLHDIIGRGGVFTAPGEAAVRAENERLKHRIDKLESDIIDLVPIGDLTGLPAWQTEKAHMMEHIAILEKFMRLWWISRQDGKPDFDTYGACLAAGMVEIYESGVAFEQVMLDMAGTYFDE